MISAATTITTDYYYFYYYFYHYHYYHYNCHCHCYYPCHYHYYYHYLVSVLLVQKLVCDLFRLIISVKIQSHSNSKILLHTSVLENFHSWSMGNIEGLAFSHKCPVSCDGKIKAIYIFLNS